jgi:hypothetical protein
MATFKVKCVGCGREYTFDPDKDTHKWQPVGAGASSDVWAKCPHCGAETRVPAKPKP